MSATIELVLGGARSGKSDWAVDRAAEVGDDVLFIATAEALDVDMRRRIEQHRGARPDAWRTLEEPLEIVERLVGRPEPPEVAILDCLTLLVSNRMLSGRLDAEDAGGIGAWVEELCAALRRHAAHSIVVSNEVGGGVVPETAAGRRFRDALGTANRALAAQADAVRLLVAGLPITLKGEE